MRRRLLTAILSAGLLFGPALPGQAITHAQQHRIERRREHARARARAIRHRRRMNTLKRVGIAAAGGAAIGALAGGGKGGAIGAIAGAGAGALYDAHQKNHGHN